MSEESPSPGANNVIRERLLELLNDPALWTLVQNDRGFALELRHSCSLSFLDPGFADLHLTYCVEAQVGGFKYEFYNEELFVKASGLASSIRTASSMRQLDPENFASRLLEERIRDLFELCRYDIRSLPDVLDSYGRSPPDGWREFFSTVKDAIKAIPSIHHSRV